MFHLRNEENIKDTLLERVSFWETFLSTIYQTSNHEELTAATLLTIHLIGQIINTTSNPQLYLATASFFFRFSTFLRGVLEAHPSITSDNKVNVILNTCIDYYSLLLIYYRYAEHFVCYFNKIDDICCLATLPFNIYHLIHPY